MKIYSVYIMFFLLHVEMMQLRDSLSSHLLNLHEPHMEAVQSFIDINRKMNFVVFVSKAWKTRQERLFLYYFIFKLSYCFSFIVINIL